jgi:hypothetical protein
MMRAIFILILTTLAFAMPSSARAANQTLTVSKSGTGTGTVVSSPAGINCGGICSASFPKNTNVTLTATPDAGSTFSGYSGACSGTTCTVRMSTSRFVTATFNLTAPPPDPNTTINYLECGDYPTSGPSDCNALDQDSSGANISRIGWTISNADSSECQLDSTGWVACTSVWATTTTVGNHVLAARAKRSSDGAVDPTPDSRTVTICPAAGCGPPPPLPQCSDGVDNDGDTLIDYPSDPGCTSTSDNDETDPIQNNCTATLAAGGNAATFFNALSPGDVGCLHTGVYGTLDNFQDFTKSGTSTAPITLQSYPGEVATLLGYTAIDSSNVIFKNLKIDVSTHLRGVGGNCPNGRAATFTLAGAVILIDHNEITASDQTNSSNGIYIQNSNEEVSHNKIHDVGACTDATFGYDHGVYIGHGSGTSIHHNWLWNIHFGWGIQIYPDSSNTHVYSNVIDSARSGLTLCSTGSNHLFEHNVVSNDTIGAMTSGCGPQGSSTNNAVQNNDSWNNPNGVGSVSGITYSGNISVDPQYVDRTNHNYTTQNLSLVDYGLWNGS